MDPHNVYAAPMAPLVHIPDAIPAHVLKKIHIGWIAAVAYGFVRLIFLTAIYGPNNRAGFYIPDLINVALMFVLALGIYQKSRICAVILLLYFVVLQTGDMVNGANGYGIFLVLLFGVGFWKGAAGTFTYHKLKKESESARWTSNPEA